MNKRFKELAEQAGAVYTDIHAASLLDYEIEKFAELLLLECLTVINQPNGVGDDDVIRISDDVKRHFGFIQ
jgi:hypothetical protein